MTRHRFRKRVIKHVLMLITIPLVLTSTGYALFSQQLSVDASADNPAFSFTQNMTVSYTHSVVAQGQSWTHTVTATVTNNGTRDTTAWASTFSLPADYSNVSCSNASCSQSGNVNTATNTSGNGIIAAGNSLIYTLSFRSSSQTYQFTSIGASATLGDLYLPLSGLTVSASAGSPKKKGSTWEYTYNMTVTNNSGQNIPGWRVNIPWNTSVTTVKSVTGAINYVETSSLLTIFSTQGLNNGSNFQYSIVIQANTGSYTMSGYTVEALQ